MLDWFRITNKYGSAPLKEGHSGRVLHDFLGHIASGVKPIPGFSGITLLAVNWGGTVHLLHSYFSILVGVQSTYRQIFPCPGDIPEEIPPPRWRISWWSPLRYGAPSTPLHGLTTSDTWGKSLHSIGIQFLPSGQVRRRLAAVTCPAGG